MSQLMKDLEACVATAKLAGPPWGNYTRMEITAEHAKKILAALEAGEEMRTLMEDGYWQMGIDRPRKVMKAWDKARAELMG